MLYNNVVQDERKDSFKSKNTILKFYKEISVGFKNYFSKNLISRANLNFKIEEL